jgi:anti-anti-sigma factor
MESVPAFSVDVRRDGANVVVVAPSGEVDLATVGRLRRALQEVRGCEVLVLDLRGVLFMDSVGVGLLLEERKRGQAEGFSLRLVPGSDEVQRLLEMTGLAARLEFVEPEGTADAQTPEA